jgi:hypothetical protein
VIEIVGMAGGKMLQVVELLSAKLISVSENKALK